MKVSREVQPGIDGRTARQRLRREARRERQRESWLKKAKPIAISLLKSNEQMRTSNKILPIARALTLPKG